MVKEKCIDTVEEIMHELTFLKGMLEKFSAEDLGEADVHKNSGSYYFEGRCRGSSTAFRLSAKFVDDIIQKIDVKE